MALSQNEIDQFHGLLNTSAPKSAPKAKGNFLTHLLPTIGGTGGGIAGGAAGGALAGSVILPGVGTVAGGLLGALLGGTIGGGAGKIAENKLEGNALGDGVLKEAGINGVMSAGPLRLLKGAGTAAKVLSGGEHAIAAETAANGGGKLLQALNAGGDRAAQPGMLKKLVTGKANDTADSLAQRGMQMNSSAFNTAHAERTGEEVGTTLRRYQIPTMSIGDAKSKVLQPGYDVHASAVKAVGDIPKADIMKEVEAIAAPHLANPIPQAREKGQAIIEQAKGVLDNLPDNIPAADLNRIKSDILSHVNHSAQDTLSKSGNDVLHGVGDAFKNTINNSADRLGIKVNPADLPKGYKSTRVGDLGEELHNLQNLITKGNQTSRVGAGKNPIGLTGTIAASGLGGPGGVMAGVGTQVLNSTTGKQLLAKGADKIASRLTGQGARDVSKAGQGLQAVGGVTGVAKRDVPVGLLSALTGGMAQSSNDQTSTDPSMNNSANTISSLSSPTDPSATDTQEDPISPLNPANIEANVQAILAGGGKMSDATAYLSLVKTMQDLKGSGGNGAKPLNATQQQQSSNAMTGLNSLQEIRSTLDANPNAALLNAIPGGSLMHSLTGTGSYDAAIQNATDVIGRLRSGGAINGDEEKRFLKMLPKAGDSKSTVEYKLSTVGDLFSRFANPTPAAPDQSSLLNALGAQ